MQFDHFNRRDFIALVGGAAVAWPVAVQAQQQGMPIIGFCRVSPGTRASRLFRRQECHNRVSLGGRPV